MPYSEDDDSQTGSMHEPTRGLSKAELRKTNKPIMEKKRRARINNCLNELKDLLLDAVDTDPARHSKLEKADILEMTVKHLQTLQRQQLAAAIASDPTVLHRFKSGFGDCASEVKRYLSRLANVPTGIRHRLGNHLNTFIAGIDHVNVNPLHHDHQLVPDPLRMEDRPSAFHCVRATRPTSPPLSPLSCDSACDSSTELETPPRLPVKTYPFPTPPSHSASDQDSSPDTQKPTVSSTTISPQTLAMRNKKLMEPLSIVIDVENYKIGIDASPKRAVDYSMRKNLKRSVVDIAGPTAKVSRTEAPERTVTITERTVTIPERLVIPEIQKENFTARSSSSPEKSAFEIRLSERLSTFPEWKPVSQPAVVTPVLYVQRSVISHTAESLARSSVEVKEKAEADTSRSRSPQQGTSSSGTTEMWRPW